MDTVTAAVHELSPEEARALFDRAARRELRISGEEFLQALDSGELSLEEERPEVMRVLMLLPLVRQL